MSFSSSMLSPGSPPSPTLTHGSSSFDELDEWLMPNEASIGKSTAFQDPLIASQDPSASLFEGLDMGEIFR